MTTQFLGKFSYSSSYKINDLPGISAMFHIKFLSVLGCVLLGLGKRIPYKLNLLLSRMCITQGKTSVTKIYNLNPFFGQSLITTTKLVPEGGTQNQALLGPSVIITDILSPKFGFIMFSSTHFHISLYQLFHEITHLLFLVLKNNLLVNLYDWIKKWIQIKVGNLWLKGQLWKFSNVRWKHM